MESRSVAAKLFHHPADHFSRDVRQMTRTVRNAIRGYLSFPIVNPFVLVPVTIAASSLESCRRVQTRRGSSFRTKKGLQSKHVIISSFILSFWGERASLRCFFLFSFPSAVSARSINQPVISNKSHSSFARLALFICFLAFWIRSL